MINMEQAKSRRAGLLIYKRARESHICIRIGGYEFGETKGAT